MSKFKKYRYSCSGNVMWATFDHGEVMATSREHALIFAKQEIQHNLDLVNAILSKNSKTMGTRIDMDLNNIEVEVVEVPSEFSEVNTSYEDDNGVTHIDGYRSEDPDCEGVIIGYIINNEVYWTNPEYQYDIKVKAAVDDHKIFQQA